MCICVYRCHRSMWMRFCVCHCAAVGSGLTVPINISIKAELSRRVEHLSFLSVLPRSIPPSSRLPSVSLTSLPSSLSLSVRRYRNALSSRHRVVCLSVAEEAFMCQERLLIELQLVLVDVSAGSASLPPGSILSP